jgi:hypothetical protein
MKARRRVPAIVWQLGHERGQPPGGHPRPRRESDAWLGIKLLSSGNSWRPHARGTVPLAIFGPANYGYRLGLLGAPTRAATAAAPLLFGLLIDQYGAGVLVFSSALSIAALVGLCTLRISTAASK